MQEIFSALKLDHSFELTNPVHLPSCFSVSRLASSSIGAVGCSMSRFIEDMGLRGSEPAVLVSQALASLWFAQSILPLDWKMPPIWDSVAGDYATKDGWIKLHTNLPHHRDSALSVLQCEPIRDVVAKRVSHWESDDLESEIVAAGGVAATLRSREEWLAHPQGIALASEPLIAWEPRRDGKMRQWNGTLERPLDGLRILDLTRVLAGPVSTRTLAGFGADVLRIDPPGWDEANVVPDITLGKRCARLDLNTSTDRNTFERLLASADIFIHGYRPNALERLGYGQLVRQQLSPNLIEVSLDAYGWSGPWAGRRGFDSLVQMSCGIASQGMAWANSQKPIPLPVQALDHATGYIMAAAALRAITSAMNGDGISGARLSLARVAELLISYPQNIETTFTAVAEQEHYSTTLEVTPWGKAKRLRAALNIDAVPMSWNRAACELGSGLPTWG